MNDSALQIGELAKLSQCSIDTLRYYEKHGLLQPSGRTAAGYRQYDATALQQLQFIQRAKAVGFSLADIHELLSLRIDQDQHSCEEVKNLTASKLQAVAVKLAELQRFQQALQQLHDACCGGPESARHCTILSTLETGQLPTPETASHHRTSPSAVERTP